MQKDRAGWGRSGVCVRVSEAGVDAVVEKFQAAGLDGTGWETALDALVGLTGSMGGQLIGIGSDASIPFNLTVGVAPESTTEFVAAGGGDPSVNSRVRVGSVVPELCVLDESAFTTADDVKRAPEYGEWIRRYDVAFGCLTPLVKSDRGLVGLAMLRSTRQGNITAERKRAFARVAAHARNAVRTQMRLQSQGLSTVTGILDALSATVFLCDSFGNVLGLSSSAEALVRDGTHLRQRRHRLFTAAPADQAALDALVVRAATMSAGGGGSALAIRDADGGDPLLVEAVLVPNRHPLGLGASVLLLVGRPRKDRTRIARAARALFGLTPAEANVSAQLALGRTVTAIAGADGVSVGTVRTHVRRIFDKAGARNQLELATLLSRFS